MLRLHATAGECARCPHLCFSSRLFELLKSLVRDAIPSHFTQRRISPSVHDTLSRVWECQVDALSSRKHAHAIEQSSTPNRAHTNDLCPQVLCAVVTAGHLHSASPSLSTSPDTDSDAVAKIRTSCHWPASLAKARAREGERAAAVVQEVDQES
jgi:hypothetical protein